MSNSVENRNRSALITGACQGVGLCTARTLAEKGFRIAGVDIQKDVLDAELEKISNEYKVETLSLQADVSNENEVIAAVSETVKKFGSIDVLVNNAGIREVATVWETSLELWNHVLSINLQGEFLFAREVLKQSMLEADSGKIVFISSIAGLRGSVQSVAYCASKWGIRGLAAGIAQDLKGTGINSTVITPGRTDTPMARTSEQWDPDIGWLDPQAIANTVLYFVSQDSNVEIPEINLFHSVQL